MRRAEEKNIATLRTTVGRKNGVKFCRALGRGARDLLG